MGAVNAPTKPGGRIGHLAIPRHPRTQMARTNHTFAKRQREIEKKRKADEKRERKQNKGKTPTPEDPPT